MERPSARALQTVRQVGLAGYAVILVTYCVSVGIPVDRLRQALWILAGILVASVGRPWRHGLRVVADWTPFIAALLIYDHTRGIADTLGRPVHVDGPLAADRWLAGGELPTVWLQERLYDARAEQWWDVASALVYASHFVVPWLLAAALYVWSRPEWAAYARRVIALSAAGLVTYSLFPAAPPWLAAREGVIDAEIVRISARGWSAIGMQGTRALFERAQADVNLVAAVPSLHAAFALLVALTIARYLRSWLWRALVLAYPLAMAFTLVYGGEHYVVDVLLGWAYVAGVLAGVGAVERWWAGRRSQVAHGQPLDHPVGDLHLVGPYQDPQAFGGVRDGRVNALGGEGAADEVGIGVTPRIRDRNE